MRSSSYKRFKMAVSRVTLTRFSPTNSYLTGSNMVVIDLTDISSARLLAPSVP